MYDKPAASTRSVSLRGSDDVVTVVNATLQDRLDVALGEVAKPVHLASISAALTMVRERPIRAVLLGHESIVSTPAVDVGRLAWNCRGALIAVVGPLTPDVSEALLALGRHGVRDAVDLSTRIGFSRLRDMLSRPEWKLVHRIASEINANLEDSTDDMRRFLDYVVRLAPSVTTIKVLADGLGVAPSSLTSRFFRAGLPSPKEYLAYIRLLYAAAILECPEVSVTQAARRLSYSSPQAFIRHVRVHLGLTVTEFRNRFPFSAFASHITFHFLGKHKEALRCFRPLGTTAMAREESKALY